MVQSLRDNLPNVMLTVNWQFFLPENFSGRLALKRPPQPKNILVRQLFRCTQLLYENPMLRSPLRLFRDVAMVKQGPVDPLIVIIGATGTGKSQVGVTRMACYVGSMLTS